MSIQANSALRRAVKLVGGPSEMARRANVSRQTVHNWIRGTMIAPEHVEAVEAATGGQITRHQLRPDLSRIFGE